MKLLQLRALNTNPITQQFAHERVSDKYNKVHTNDILTQFARHGWTEHKKSMVNSVKYAGYQKHLIRLRNPDFMIGDDHLEIILTNAHNGTSSVVIQCGIYRMACANGIIIGKDFAKHRIRHIGFTYEKLRNAINDIELNLFKLKEIVARMKATTLTHAQANELKYACYNARLKDTNAINIDFNKLPLNRAADLGNDLWTFYNRVQEAVIRGGIEYETIQKAEPNHNYSVNKFVQRVSRPVKSIDQVIKLNEQMFEIATKMVA